MKEFTSIKLTLPTHERLVKWQLKEQARRGRKITLSDTVDSLLELGEAQHDDR